MSKPKLAVVAAVALAASVAVAKNVRN